MNIVFVVVSDSNVHAVAHLANKYEMRGVVDICEHYLLQQDDTQSIESTYKALITAQNCRMADLLRYCVKIIGERQTLSEMVNNSEFKKLRDDTILKVYAKRLEMFEDLFKLGTMERCGKNFVSLKAWNNYMQSVVSTTT